MILKTFMRNLLVMLGGMATGILIVYIISTMM